MSCPAPIGHGTSARCLHHHLAMLPFLLVLLLGGAPGHPTADPGPSLRADAREDALSMLAGAWTGQWQARGSSAEGSVEVIFTEDRERGAVLAQFTFMHGANALKSRREGTAIDGHVRFEAPDDGEIVLRLEGRNRLIGDFSGGPTLPAEAGSLELTPAR